jgi:glycosyltransferase involved in cell wall biosynthesis
MKTVAIIPALNEAASLPGVLAEIPSGWLDEVIVVDGGSTDGTPELARRAGARIIVQPQRGYGLACFIGAQAARSAEILVFLDGDGSDDPADLPRLLEPVRAGAADLVLGSRLAGKNSPQTMPSHQRAGNWLAGFLVRTLYKFPLTDLSPFRCVGADFLNNLGMQELSYGWPTEMIVKALRCGGRVIELPVHHRPRSGGRSKISGTLHGTILAAFFITKTIIRYGK